MSAHEFVSAVVTGEFESWDTPPDVGDVGPEYAQALASARSRTGVDESVITGVGVVGGVRTALVVSEFGFLGGSIGRAAGRRIVAAVRRATTQRLPVLAAPASGGTRMQEGTPAFLQMAAISAAVADHRDARLPYLVYLRHPTTGGVFASWGSMGLVTWAAPGALIGFLGPRVYAGLYGKPFPDGVQTAENLQAHRIVDDVIALPQLAERTGSLLALLSSPDDADASQVSVRADADPPAADVWAAVQSTRAPDRPGLRSLLHGHRHEVIAGPGALVVAIGEFAGHRAVVIGHDRAVERAGDELMPDDLALAVRGISVAEQFDLPIVTVIDTAGASLSVPAEESGLAARLAECLARLLRTRVPTLSILMGQGAGGAALALFPADRRVAAADAWLAPLPPEGASLIVYRDTDHAAELVDRQRISVSALQAEGAVDVIVPTSDLVSGLSHEIAAWLAQRPTVQSARRVRV